MDGITRIKISAIERPKFVTLFREAVQEAYDQLFPQERLSPDDLLIRNTDGRRLKLTSDQATMLEIVMNNASALCCIALAREEYHDKVFEIDAEILADIFADALLDMEPFAEFGLSRDDLASLLFHSNCELTDVPPYLLN